MPASKQPVYFCLDIGATSVKSAVLSPLNGEIIERGKFLTREPHQPFEVDKLVKQGIAAVKAAAKAYRLLGVGVSTCGGVDMQTGAINYANATMPLYPGTNWKILFKRIKADMPVIVMNDIKAAGSGEFLGSRISSGVMVTLGTGFGAALFLEGRLQLGTRGCAGEIGAMPWPWNSALTLDTACSAVVASEQIKRILDDPDYVLSDHAKIKRAPAALAVRAEWINNVARALILLNMFFDPELFIIGGGPSKDKKLIPELFAAVPPSFKKIQAAKRGNDAAFYGLLPYLQKALA